MNGNLTSLGMTDGSVQWEVSTSESFSESDIGQASGSLSTSEINVTVVDQDGDPVPNASLQQTHFMRSLFDVSDVEDLEQHIQEYEQQIRDPEPPNWVPPENFNWESQTSADAEYVLAHNPKQFGVDGDFTTQVGASFGVSRSIGPPSLALNEQGNVIFSVWEPGTGADNELDNSFPGGIKSEGTVVIEQLSPSGEVTDKRTLDAEATFTIDRTWPLDDSSRDVVMTTLPDGHFYRVYPQSNPSASIVVSVGNPNDIASNIQDRLEDEKGELTARSQEIKDRISNDTIRQTTVQTNANGEVTIKPPAGASRTVLGAHKGPDELMTAVRSEMNLSEGETPTISELQTAAKGDIEYNGTVGVTTEPVSVNSSHGGNVDVPMETVPYRRYGDIEDFNDFLDWAEGLAFGEMNQLPPGWETKLDDLNQSQLRTLHGEMRTLVKATGQEPRYIDEHGQPIPQSDELDETGLRSDIIRLTTILESQPSIDPCESADICGPNIDEGLLNMEIPTEGNIDEDATSVMLYWSDGSPPEPMSEEYWSTDSTLNPRDGETLVIEDFPIEEKANDRPLADVRPKIVMEDGEEPMRKPSIPVKNPGFSGSIPDMDAWDLNQLYPGPDQRVTVRLRTEDDAYGGIKTGQAYDPAGNQIDTNVSDGQIAFTTSGQGAHTVRVTYTDSTGAEFTDSIRIKARDEAVSEPPTLRFERGMGSDVAVVGHDLRSARLGQTDGGATDLTVVQSDTETPIGTLHVHAEEQITGDRDLSMSVLHPDESNVRSNVNVNIHTTIAATTLLYRNDDAITHGGETVHGEVRHITGEAGDRDKRVIRTYTDADGTLELQTVADPGYLESFDHWLEYNLPAVNDIPTPSFEFLTFGIVFGTGLYKRRDEFLGVAA